jgi:hypothetical protein
MIASKFVVGEPDDLTLPQEMKELGFPQHGAQLYWCKDQFGWKTVSKIQKEINDEHGLPFEYCAAYLSDELRRWFRDCQRIGYGDNVYNLKMNIDSIGYEHECAKGHYFFSSDIEKIPDRYAEALRWLAKEGLIKPKNLSLMK